MSYRLAYNRKGLSARSRQLMELEDEKALEEDISGNVLRDSVNYEGVEVPIRASQQSPNSNANPSPGNNEAVRRVRLMGALDIYPDENSLTAGDDSQLIRADLDGFYNCGVDTNEVSPSQPGRILQMKSFGNDPSYNGSKRNLRYQGAGDIAGNLNIGMSGQNVSVTNMNFSSSTPMPQPANPGPEVIEAKAKNYDDSVDLPGKESHAKRFEGEMHPDFVVYAKAVIFDIWDKVKGKVKLNSTFRTVNKQREMYNYVKAYRAKHGKNKLPPGYGGAPAKPGYSKHNLGVAIDFSVEVKGINYTSAKTKSQWEATGVPAIIKSNGLRWGGDFRKNYDPIHMDLSVSKEVRSQIVAKTKSYSNPKQAIAAMSAIPIRPGSDSTPDTHANPVETTVPS